MCPRKAFNASKAAFSPQRSISQMKHDLALHRSMTRTALGSMPGGIRPHIIRMRRPGRPMKKHVVHSQTKILDTTSANVWSRL
jgi:hypothetical protein